MVAKVDGQPNFIWSNIKGCTICQTPTVGSINYPAFIPYRLTGHHSNVLCRPTHQTTTSPSANWSSLQCTLLANPLDPPPHSQLTGHHSNVCQPTHWTHHPTVSQLVITPTYPVGQPISPPLHCWPTGHNSNVPC